MRAPSTTETPAVTFFPLACFFVLGALVASFVGVAVVRLNTGQSIARGRSKCDACGRVLGVFDLVPLLSYGATRGRSRCCRARLSPLAPLTEAALGMLFALSYAAFGLTMALPALLLALALLLGLVLYDLAHMMLPGILLWPFVVAATLFAWLDAPDGMSFLLVAIVALVLALLLALIHLFSRGRAMGLSDAPLCFGLALIAGPAALSGFAYAFWIGAVIGIVILSLRPRGSRMGSEVPFAPFLAAGFLLAAFTPWNPFLFISTLVGVMPQ